MIVVLRGVVCRGANGVPPLQLSTSPLSGRIRIGADIVGAQGQS